MYRLRSLIRTRVVGNSLCAFRADVSMLDSFVYRIGQIEIFSQLYHTTVQLVEYCSKMVGEVIRRSVDVDSFMTLRFMKSIMPTENRVQ